MKTKIVLVARILLSVPWLVIGLNYYFNFLPQPPPTGDAAEYMAVIYDHVFPVLKPIEVISGLCLLSGFFVPLALVVLAPIMVNIFIFHFIHLDGTVVPAFVILAIYLFLAYSYRDHFKSVLSMKGQVS